MSTSEIVFGGVRMNLECHADWQKNLIHETKRHRDPDSEHARQARQQTEHNQTKLIGAAETGSAATGSYLLHEALRVGSVRPDIPTLPNLTPGEMGRLPVHAEREVARTLNGRLTPAQAAEPAVWALCHAAWIRAGVFGPDPAVVFLGTGTPEARSGTSCAAPAGFAASAATPLRWSIAPYPPHGGDTESQPKRHP